MRAEFTDDQLFALCRSQLARMFGPQAAAPMAEFLKDWAKDKFTATALDLESNGGHSPQPQLAPQSGPWSECLLGIGSEWAQQFPGYIAGAIEAADKGIQIVARHVKARGETCQ
jgi:monoamine oxidase